VELAALVVCFKLLFLSFLLALPLEVVGVPLLGLEVLPDLLHLVAASSVLLVGPLAFLVGQKRRVATQLLQSTTLLLQEQFRGSERAREQERGEEKRRVKTEGVTFLNFLVSLRTSALCALGS